MSLRQVALPRKAMLTLSVDGHDTVFELDSECLDALSLRIYGDKGMAGERSLGLLVHGFLGQFVDCNEPLRAERRDAAYQLGRRLGKEH